MGFKQRMCYVSPDDKNSDDSDSVRTFASTPHELSVDSALCVMDDSLYAVGIGPAYNELWKWNAASNWTRCADMPSGRRRHCVAVVGSTLFVLGGVSMNTLAATRTAARYDH